MSRILIVYETFDGQAERIAARIGAALVKRGHEVGMRRAARGPASLGVDAYEAVVVGGAVRYGRLARALQAFARANAAALARLPNAFFAVSLSAGGPGANPAEAKRHVDQFVAQTGWHPHMRATFAGALPYTRYGLFRRAMMRFIVGRAGGDTDTTRDHEYTDWAAVDRFAADFARALPTRA